MPLAPAKTLLHRLPDALAELLSAHGVPAPLIEAEHADALDHRGAPTANRSLVGVMNEFAFLAGAHRAERPDLMRLSQRLATTPCGPLFQRHISPDRELAALITGPSAPARPCLRATSRTWQMSVFGSSPLSRVPAVSVSVGQRGPSRVVEQATPVQVLRVAWLTRGAVGMPRRSWSLTDSDGRSGSISSVFEPRPGRGPDECWRARHLGDLSEVRAVRSCRLARRRSGRRRLPRRLPADCRGLLPAKGEGAPFPAPSPA